MKTKKEEILDYEKRIKELEKEIGQFDCERLKRQERAQQAQLETQQEFLNINNAILTRQGEIIGLKRLIKEKNDPNTS